MEVSGAGGPVEYVGGVAVAGKACAAAAGAVGDVDEEPQLDGGEDGRFVEFGEDGGGQGGGVVDDDVPNGAVGEVGQGP